MQLAGQASMHCGAASASHSLHLSAATTKYALLLVIAWFLQALEQSPQAVHSSEFIFIGMSFFLETVLLAFHGMHVDTQDRGLRDLVFGIVEFLDAEVRHNAIKGIDFLRDILDK